MKFLGELIHFGPDKSTEPNIFKPSWMACSKQSRFEIADNLAALLKSMQGKYMPIPQRVALADAILILRQPELHDVEQPERQIHDLPSL